jgi:hypothetical protein
MPYYMDCSTFTDEHYPFYVDFAKQCEEAVWQASRRRRCPNDWWVDQGLKISQACCGESQSCSMSNFDCTTMPGPDADPTAPTCRCLVEELHSRCYSHEDWDHDLSQFGIKDRYAFEDLVKKCQAINSPASCTLPDPSGH